MWAVFDKDGKLVSRSIGLSETDCWTKFILETELRNYDGMEEYIEHKQSIGYSCQPVVVMLEEVYKEVVNYVNRIIDNTGHDPDYAMDATSETYKQFLKAGE